MLVTTLLYNKREFLLQRTFTWQSFKIIKEKKLAMLNLHCFYTRVNLSYQQKHRLQESKREKKKISLTQVFFNYNSLKKTLKLFFF